jgi:hypothetical protein
MLSLSSSITSDLETYPVQASVATNLAFSAWRNPKRPILSQSGKPNPLVWRFAVAKEKYKGRPGFKRNQDAE